MIPRLKELYDKQITEKLMEKLNVKNKHQVPKVEKIILNMGLGEDASDGKKLKSCIDDMALISGQKPILCTARKSVAGFKIRDGMIVGTSVTLRGVKMYTFLTKLIHIVLPRLRDFRGINPNSFDGRGNYNFGLNEQLIFPEISYDDITKLRGMDISIVTTAKTDAEALFLLKAFQVPFGNF